MTETSRVIYSKRYLNIISCNDEAEIDHKYFIVINSLELIMFSFFIYHLRHFITTVKTTSKNIHCKFNSAGWT